MSFIQKLKSFFSNIKNAIFISAAIIMGLFIAKTNKQSKNKEDSKKKINKSEGKKEVLQSNIKDNNQEVQELDEELLALQKEVKEIFQEENKENLDEFFDKRGF